MIGSSSVEFAQINWLWLVVTVIVACKSSTVSPFVLFCFCFCFSLHANAVYPLLCFLQVKILSLASPQCWSCGAGEQDLQWHGGGHTAIGWGKHTFSSFKSPLLLAGLIHTAVCLHWPAGQRPGTGSSDRTVTSAKEPPATGTQWGLRGAANTGLGPGTLYCTCSFLSL